jgi:SAM-dependent methyltransferase
MEHPRDNSHAVSRLLQSPEEWAARNTVLSDTIGELINTYIQIMNRRALDVGCQQGTPADMLAQRTNLLWSGIDPAITDTKYSQGGIELRHGLADQIPFPDATFDCVTLANVYEHIPPDRYDASIGEIKRVLKPGGILVGQLPNPYFPIESHSRLPFMGWLPYRLQRVYWHLTPVSWEHDFYVVTIKDLKKRALSQGFKTELIRNFNYPLDVIPRSVRWAARLAQPIMKIMPWAWQFVFRKPAH